jgi:hypothetical protein
MPAGDGTGPLGKGRGAGCRRRGGGVNGSQAGRADSVPEAPASTRMGNRYFSGKGAQADSLEDLKCFVENMESSLKEVRSRIAQIEKEEAS